MTSLPALVHYSSEQEYKEHYQREYCRAPAITFDGIRVFFHPSKFEHAFYESSHRNGVKDTFSPIRSQRIDWIKATLENPNARLYQGYESWTKSNSPRSRVQVVYEDFVVIIGLSLTRKGVLKGNFITCYQADNSMPKIKKSPRWKREDCMKVLKK